MPDDNIKRLITKDQFKTEQELFNELSEIINSYEGKVSLVAALGILDIMKDEIKEAKRKERENK